ncbi:MAG: 5'-deoxyadenosine deaminase [Candidatus Sericytochromatia bacterium]|nr:5'-deoxyadenosine deaminase [Candidatus Sericytochromatia bacterium]
MNSSPLWITHAVILTQNEQRDVLRGHIELAGDRIVALHPEETPVPTHVKRLDASGLVVMPGFIQPHIHLCQTLFRNMADDLELMDWLSQRIWPFEAAHDAESLYLSAQLGIQELLASGTTCILDMATVKHTESVFRAVESTGIRANVGKCLMDHPDTTLPYLRESTAEALAEARQLFARWHGQANDRIRVSYAPRFVVSCSEDLLTAVRDLAAEQGAIIHTHSSENQKEVELVRELVGHDNAAYFDSIGLMSERLVLAHCIWLSEAETGLLQRSGTHVVHCPSSNLKLASGFARVPEMLAQGINVGLAADGAPCNNNLNALQEMRLAALMHKPGRGPRTLPAGEVLDMATRNGAKALGWQNEIGSLEPGKKADIIALDLDQPSNFLPYSPDETPGYAQIASAIVYGAQPANVRWTMVDGDMVALDGRALKIPSRDLEPVRVRDAQRKLLERVKNLAQ